MSAYPATPNIYTDFYYDADALTLWIDQNWSVILKVGIAIVAVLAILAVIFYVFGSLSIYTMAERRGFSASFLAWIPVVRWVVLGHVASDVHRARTEKRAFYGTAILITTLIYVGAWSVNIFSSEPQVLAGILTALFATAENIIMLFALSEVYRDYSSHWVGLLIFTCILPVLKPVFLLGIHKNMPVSVRMRHARQSQEEVNEPAAAEEAAEPENCGNPTENSDTSPEESLPSQESAENEPDAFPEAAGEETAQPPAED